MLQCAGNETALVAVLLTWLCYRFLRRGNDPRALRRIWKRYSNDKGRRMLLSFGDASTKAVRRRCILSIVAALGRDRLREIDAFCGALARRGASCGDGEL